MTWGEKIYEKLTIRLISFLTHQNKLVSWQKRGFNSTSGTAFFVGFFTQKIVKSMLLSTRCAQCDNSNSLCTGENCVKNWDGSSKGMESQAALEGVKDVFDSTSGTVRVSRMCGDDDSSFRKILKSVEDGGKLEGKYGEIIICSDLSHRIKNMCKRIYELEKMAKAKSPLDTRLAKSLDIGVRASARRNCSRNVYALQDAMKGSVLHNFNVHTHCDECFCNDLHCRMDVWRLWHFYDYLCHDTEIVKCFQMGMRHDESNPYSTREFEEEMKSLTDEVINRSKRSEIEVVFSMIMDEKVSIRVFKYLVCHLFVINHPIVLHF